VEFASPLILLALIALAVGIGAYVDMQRRRRQTAQRFASAALLANVAPTGPRWRRHVPMALFAVALAGLIVAAAKPRASVAVPVEQAAIMLVTDVSGSMTAQDVKPNRLEAARTAARSFVSDVPEGVRVGVLAFNGRPRVLQRPTRDREAALAALAQLRPSGGTATGDALNAAITALRRTEGANGKRPPSAIVLLSDGESVKGADPVTVARAARRLRIPVYTVALGTPQGTIRAPRPGGQGGFETRPVPPDPETLRQIARVTGGEAFTADDGDELATVYDRLGSQITHKKEKREVGYAFVGGALVLLVAGSGLSLAWFGRLA